MRMRIKPEVDFRFLPPSSSSVQLWSWGSLPSLVQIGINRFKVIQLKVKFVISSAAILDFEKWYFGAHRRMWDDKVKLRLKFCENRTDDYEVIQVYVNLKFAAPPSWITLFLNFCLPAYVPPPVLLWNEIWCIWLERFRSCGVLKSFHFPYTLTWNFTANAHKTGSWFPIFTANELIRPTRVLVVCAKFGEDRWRIADAIVWDIHTYIQTEKPTCAADLIIYHLVAIATW